jgi:hypothetical protein
VTAVSKTWTSSADFATGTLNNANTATTGEVRKNSNATTVGTWNAEYDAGPGSHPLWELLSITRAVSGAGTLDVYARSSATPGDFGGVFQHVATIGPSTGTTNYGLSTAYGRRRYFQIFCILTPDAPTNVANVRLQAVQVDGQTTTPNAPATPSPLEGERGIAGAKSGFASQAGPRAAWASAAGPRAGFARGLG